MALASHRRRRRRRGQGAVGGRAVAGGLGSARLAAAVLPDAGVPGQFVAATLAVWNPYVAERLLQGHWSLLVGYGCLPWVAATVLRMRTSRTRGADTLSESAPLWTALCALAFWTALAGMTPTGLMLAATVALVCSSAPGSGPAATAVRGGGRWRGGTRGAAVVDRRDRVRVVVVVTGRRRHGLRCARRTGPRARWAAWPASAESGTARPYPTRGQRFSRWWPRSCCLASWWRPACRSSSAGRRGAAAHPCRRRRRGADADGDGAGAGGRGVDGPCAAGISAWCATRRSGWRWRCRATRLRPPRPW